MIVWFNCKISDIRPNPQPRYHLRNDNRFDIARYSFASFVPLLPLISKIVFNLEMADGHAHQQAEMEEWLRKIFPEDKLIINWYRCNNIAQWREMQALFNEIDDDLIFPAGNEDHIFMDSDIEIFRRGNIIINHDNTTAASLMTSHWPENIRAAHHYQGPIMGSVNLSWVHYSIGCNDAIRVMKKGFFNWYIDQVKDPNMFVFRTEHWNAITLPENLMYVPTKEQFRHFDGYAHVNIGPDYAPPLEIPLGFFESGIVIKYGFTDRDPNCVNINPLADTLYAADGMGTDYKWCLEDIPAFWKPYIKEIIVAPDINEAEMKEARDINLLTMSRLHFDWPHFGIKFDKSNTPPVEWLNPHMLLAEFNN
jgi:hypothetical protein